jgi:hypothetical protein
MILHDGEGPLSARYSSFGLISAQDRLSPTKETDLLAWVRVTRTLPLGESGASSVKGGSERRGSAAWRPVTDTGQSPDT